MSISRDPARPFLDQVMPGLSDAYIAQNKAIHSPSDTSHKGKGVTKCPGCNGNVARSAGKCQNCDAKVRIVEKKDLSLDTKELLEAAEELLGFKTPGHDQSTHGRRRGATSNANPPTQVGLPKGALAHRRSQLFQVPRKRVSVSRRIANLGARISAKLGEKKRRKNPTMETDFQRKFGKRKRFGFTLAAKELLADAEAIVETGFKTPGHDQLTHGRKKGGSGKAKALKVGDRVFFEPQGEQKGTTGGTVTRVESTKVKIRYNDPYTDKPRSAWVPARMVESAIAAGQGSRVGAMRRLRSALR